MPYEITTYYADMPVTIKSYVVCNPDSTYTVILNSKLSYEQNLISCEHEIMHILNGDYEKKCNIDIIEINAHM